MPGSYVGRGGVNNAMCQINHIACTFKLIVTLYFTIPKANHFTEIKHISKINRIRRTDLYCHKASM
jgi:hypothetical protein